MKYIIDAPYFIRDVNRLAFSPADYSKFKFGSSRTGAKFGEQIFPLVLPVLNNSSRKYNRIIVYSSPYNYIPTATYTMANRFYELLDEHHSFSGEVLLHKINRSVTYTVDYGNLSATERLRLIGNDSFNFEVLPEPDDLLIFLDDIKITGSHERVICNMLQRYSIQNDCCFFYYAILENESIHPSFENDLNYAYVNSLQQLIEVLKLKDFRFNTRFIKYVLASETSDFISILSVMDRRARSELLQLAEGNSYHEFDTYAENFKLLRSSLS